MLLKGPILVSLPIWLWSLPKWHYNLRERWYLSRSGLVSPMWGSPGKGQNLRPFLSTVFSASERVWSDKFATLSKSDKRLSSSIA